MSDHHISVADIFIGAVTNTNIHTVKIIEAHSYLQLTLLLAKCKDVFKSLSFNVRSALAMFTKKSEV